MKTITVQIDVNTDEDIETIKKAVKRGIYVGLDTSPYYVAQPANVAITFINNT